MSARRSLAAALAVLAGLLGLALAPTRAAALAPQDAGYDCTASGGIYVYVQGQGGGCAHGSTTGWSTLTAAGFTPSDSCFAGFVCQINGYPANPGPPSGQAYWAYWWKSPGGAWQYSTLGARTRQSVPGTIEGWVFGNGGTPPDYAGPVAPPVQPPPPPPAPPSTQAAPPPPTTAPAPATVAPPPPAPATLAPSTATAPGGQASSEAEASAAPPEEPSASPSASAAAPTSATPTPSASPSTAATTATTAATAAAAPAQGRGAAADAGSPVGLVATVLVLALAAAGAVGWYAHQRSSH